MIDFFCLNCGLEVKFEKDKRPINCPCGKAFFLSLDVEKDKKLLDQILEYDLQRFGLIDS